MLKQSSENKRISHLDNLSTCLLSLFSGMVPDSSLVRVQLGVSWEKCQERFWHCNHWTNKRDQWDWDSDLAAHSTAADTEHSPGHWRTLPPLHKWDTLLPQQNNMKLYGSTRVYWHSLSIYLSFLGGESDSSVKIHNVDIFRSSCTLLYKMDQNGSKVKAGQN